MREWQEKRVTETTINKLQKIGNKKRKARTTKQDQMRNTTH
jgi:hypothetical protein